MAEKTDFRTACASVDQATEALKSVTARTKHALEEVSYIPATAETGPRPEYLLHLSKTKRL